MPLGRASAPPERGARPSLVDRVTLATAAAAAVSALAASLAAVAAADRLVRDAEDRRLRETADLVLREVNPGTGAGELARAVEEEIAELGPSSMGLVVRQGGRVVGGDQRLPVLPSGTCESRAWAGATLRACASEAGGISVVVGAARVSVAVGTLTLVCLASAVVAALGAAIVSRRAATWALDPLTRLRASLASVAVHEPSAVTLSDDERCEEVRALRQALADLVERLGVALGAARRFSAEAAHELRTPLTTIRMELDLLGEEMATPHERAAVDRVRARVFELGLLVDHLLALATAAEPTRMHLSAVALEDVVHDAVARLPEDRARRVTVRADAQGMVRGDETLLAALLDNAVDNALKFSGAAAVLVTISETADAVLIEVRDHGPGVPEALRARVFDPFFRTPEARGAATRGHGIGLALVARIASSHGGSAELVNPPDDGRGACLRITVPGWRPDEALPPQ